MKNSSLTTRLVTVFLTLAVLAYFGFQTWNYFTRPEMTTAVYSYHAERVLPLSGFVVRDEEVIDCSDALVELTRDEGERVAKGGRVAVIYQSADALDAEREAAALRAQREQLVHAQSAARDTEAALRLDSEIEAHIVALHAALSTGSYAAADGAVTELETTVLRREYAYRGSEDLSAHISDLDARIAALSAAAGGSRAVTAPFAGTYSAVADGYEAVLTPAALAHMTPSAFEQLAPAPVSSTVGKLIRGTRWYYAAVIADADAASLAKGQSLALAFSGADTSLPVTVESVGESEGGRRLLVLSSSRGLSGVSMLRAQNADLILESYTGLRIPKNALRVGEEQQLGVYCRIGRQAWFKPVELLYQGEDYCLVQPGEIQAVRDSDYIFYTLRAGDEAIVSAEELYNGKVLEQS